MPSSIYPTCISRIANTVPIFFVHIFNYYTMNFMQGQGLAKSRSNMGSLDLFWLTIE